MNDPRKWKNEEKVAYVQNQTLKMLELYIESYLIDDEKGFKTLKERDKRLSILSNGIHELIQDSSEFLGISQNEIIDIIEECLLKKQLNAEIRKNYNEEYDLLRKMLKEVVEKEDLEK